LASNVGPKIYAQINEASAWANGDEVPVPRTRRVPRGSGTAEEARCWCAAPPAYAGGGAASGARHGASARRCGEAAEQGVFSRNRSRSCGRARAVRVQARALFRAIVAFASGRRG